MLLIYIMTDRNKVLDEEKDLIYSKQFYEDNKEIYRSYLYYNIFLVLGIVALGGINKNNLNKLKLLNCIGFAGISYFE